MYTVHVYVCTRVCIDVCMWVCLDTYVFVCTLEALEKVCIGVENDEDNF